MNIRGKWLDDKSRIYVYEFVGLWTWQEYDRCCQEFTELLNAQSKPIYVILDMSHTQYVPPGARLWAKRPAHLHHEKLNLTLLVSANAYLRSLVRLYRIGPTQDNKALILCNTMNEALLYIQDGTDVESGTD